METYKHSFYNSNDIDHNVWLEEIKRIAGVWSRRYPHLDEEEIFSELLVAYAEALNRHEAGRGNMFGTTFFWCLKTAIKKLLRAYDKEYKLTQCKSVEDRLEETLDEDKEDVLSFFADTTDSIGRALDELDTVPLDPDTFAVIQYYMTHEVSTKGQSRHAVVGAATIARDIRENLGMGYRQARRCAEQMLEWIHTGSCPVFVSAIEGVLL